MKSLELKALQNKIWVAPMAGISDSPFRVINKRFGAKHLISEMLSTEGLVRKQKRTIDLLRILPEEETLYLQLFGSRAEAFYESILLLAEEFPYITGININAGCPVKKVVRNGAGASLLKDSKVLERLLKVSRRAVDELKRKNKAMEFSLKIRSGWDSKNYNEIAKIAEDTGVELLIMHARTAKMLYSGRANYDDIKDLKANTKLPVVANGDILSITEGKKVLEYTGADAFMVGRILVGNPWFFKGISKKDLSLKEIKDVLMDHIKLSVEFYGESRAYSLLKKHIIYYVKGNSIDTSVEAKNSRKDFFNEVSLSKSVARQVELIEEFFT